MIRDLTEFEVLMTAYDNARSRTFKPFDGPARGLRADRKEWDLAWRELYLRGMVEDEFYITPRGEAELRRFASRRYGGLGSGG